MFLMQFAPTMSDRVGLRAEGIAHAHDIVGSMVRSGWLTEESAEPDQAVQSMAEYRPLLAARRCHREAEKRIFGNGIQ